MSTFGPILGVVTLWSALLIFLLSFIKGLKLLLVVLLKDEFLWNHSHDGNLSFKDAYLFHCQEGQQISWAKSIWNPAIPPSKIFLLWRSLHGKLPTDENLSLGGCCIPSMCNLCGLAAESTSHLFLTCNFATSIWKWLGSILQVHCSFSSINDSLKLCSPQNSPLCNLVILVAVINIFNVIWFCRNQSRFNDRPTYLGTAINLIISGVSLSGNNNNLTVNSSIYEFVILKAFNVQIKNVHNLVIKEVLWQPPCFNWVKCNIDGSSLGNPGLSSCGGLFRNCSATFLGAFAYNLGISNSLVAELNGAMFAIELSVQKGWLNLWLETDSMLVVSAFKNPHVIPWQIKTRWHNCIHLTHSLNFVISHIYRECNSCADKLANLGLSLASHTWWCQPPNVIKEDMGRNSLGRPFYRFS
ncbi:hypothetical protein TSUD_221100 [Trifolium subterraneum]|uniref:Uncharacterized protein n=1 Tax=Trifolium subterraneum TaxID=3900 RepID=A0A2Z6M8F2_TRISU|nr:hypothetical protein TSUD_221100 [Trifolium subterraneum]